MAIIVKTRVGAGRQLTCYLDADYSACQDTASAAVTALSRHKLDKPLLHGPVGLLSPVSLICSSDKSDIFTYYMNLLVQQSIIEQKHVPRKHLHMPSVCWSCSLRSEKEVHWLLSSLVDKRSRQILVSNFSRLSYQLATLKFLLHNFVWKRQL